MNRLNLILRNFIRFPDFSGFFPDLSRFSGISGFKEIDVKNFFVAQVVPEVYVYAKNTSFKNS